MESSEGVAPVIEVLQIASAVLGGGIASVVVSEYTPEFQWAQKSFRPLYAEPKADAAQAKVFPTALLASDLDKAVASTLAKRGFTPANTLFGYSVCSDEVNFKDEQQVQLLRGVVITVPKCKHERRHGR